MPVLESRIPKQEWDQQASARNGIVGLALKHSAEEPDVGLWKPAMEKIIALQRLADDWDGAGAKAPTLELLRSAIGLAYLLLAKGIGPPDRVVPGIEGEVIFEWQDPDGTYAEVEIVRPFFAEVIVIEPGKPAKYWSLPTE